MYKIRRSMRRIPGPDVNIKCSVRESIVGCVIMEGGKTKLDKEKLGGTLLDLRNDSVSFITESTSCTRCTRYLQIPSHPMFTFE